SDRRKLVYVAHNQDGRLVRHRLHKRLHEHDVDHGGLVDHQQAAIERIVLPTPEAASPRVYLQQPMDGLGREAGRLAHALRSAAGWRAQQKASAFRREDTQDRLDDGGLANAGTAGNDQRLGCQREPDRGDLAFAEGKTDTLLDPRQGLVGINPGPRQQATCQQCQPVSDRAFRPMQTSQKYAVRLANPVGNHRAGLQLKLKRALDQLLWYLEQLL